MDHCHPPHVRITGVWMHPIPTVHFNPSHSLGKRSNVSTVDQRYSVLSREQLQVPAMDTQEEHLQDTQCWDLVMKPTPFFLSFFLNDFNFIYFFIYYTLTSVSHPSSPPSSSCPPLLPYTPPAFLLEKSRPPTDINLKWHSKFL